MEQDEERSQKKEMTAFYPGSKMSVKTYEQPEEVTESNEETVTLSNPRIALLNGVETKFYTIGELARLLNRQSVTIRKWEAEGIIPKATFIAPSGDKRGKRRLYTEDQILGLIQIAKEEGVFEPSARGAWKSITETQFRTKAIELFRRLNEANKKS